MASIINVSIDVTKLDKSKFIQGKKGTYANLTISVNDETNSYGQNVSVSENQTKEQREAKEPKSYVGNGKVIWTDGNVKTAEQKQDNNATSASNEQTGDSGDGLPF